MNLKLHVWRQRNAQTPGQMVDYLARDIDPNMSFLEMLDKVNDELEQKGQDPIAFDHDCREGICGTCSLVINGIPHGSQTGTTTCQLHMRKFKDGAEVWIEPWRAKAFPVVKDLVVDRTAFDRIIQKGGFIGVNTGQAPEANSLPVAKKDSDLAMDAAACIGCGACVAGCKNGSAMLFVAAKVSHLGLLPQGQAERKTRVLGMVEQMQKEAFGNCTNQYECEAVCPKEISVRFIARMNRDWFKAALSREEETAGGGVG